MIFCIERFLLTKSTLYAPVGEMQKQHTIHDIRDGWSLVQLFTTFLSLCPGSILELSFIEIAYQISSRTKPHSVYIKLSA